MVILMILLLYDLYMLKEGETLADLIQRYVAKFGDDSGENKVINFSLLICSSRHQDVEESWQCRKEEDLFSKFVGTASV